MAITRPCYVTRELVMRATDVKFTARFTVAVDRAIETASESIDGLCHRRFYNVDTTQRWDWPNFQRAYPWRVWFDQREIADVTTNVPVVTTGGVVIPASQIFWGPWNYAPPYTFLELDRSTNATFGTSQTPQRDIAITATFGYWNRTAPAGALNGAINASVTTINVSRSDDPGVGDIITVDAERMLVTDRNMVTTTQSQIGAGCSTASMADRLLTVSDGTKFFTDEVILLDSERMLIVDVAGNTLNVVRQWDGTVLQTHNSATIYAGRALTVVRGANGTTATSHADAAPISAAVVPAMVRDCALAEAVVQTLQETGGYAEVQGEDGAKLRSVGASLGMSREKVLGSYGRKSRHRVV